MAADRELAAQLRTVVPEITTMSVQNRRFLGRVVRHLAEQGIDQFLDIGTGLPTRNNVHEVAQSVNPTARVVYVDNDPTVLVHARALLAENPNTIVVNGDLRRPSEFLMNDELRTLIDFSRPVAVLLFGVLYFLTDEDKPYEVVAQLREAVVPGSYLAISHVVSEDRPDEFATAARIYGSAPHRESDPTHTRESVRTFFDGMDMVEPGLVSVRDWRPDSPDDSPSNWMMGGLARQR
ncbi:MAG TPA: SAM-dependent methyltransferase [Pseudonocardiaceae bacterium]|nr:SAM-dependent methyltransferase [Pseudonocardiaceae bacterium]